MTLSLINQVLTDVAETRQNRKVSRLVYDTAYCCCYLLEKRYLTTTLGNDLLLIELLASRHVIFSCPL